MALASPATTIAGLIAVAEASREAFGGRTAINLPALSVTVREILDALRSVVHEAHGLVRFEPDPTIARVVSSSPSRLSTVRAAHSAWLDAISAPSCCSTFAITLQPSRTPRALDAS